MNEKPDSFSQGPVVNNLNTHRTPTRRRSGLSHWWTGLTKRARITMIVLFVLVLIGIIVGGAVGGVHAKNNSVEDDDNGGDDDGGNDDGYCAENTCETNEQCSEEEVGGFCNQGTRVNGRMCGRSCE